MGPGRGRFNRAEPLYGAQWALIFREGDQRNAEAYQHHLGDAGARVHAPVQARDEVRHRHI